MRKLFLIALLAVAAVAGAQEKKFTIKGEMSSAAFCYSEGFVQEVSLEQNVNGEKKVIAKAMVQDNRFTIEGTVPETFGIYEITGFDNGTIQLFLEEGVINVGPFDAAYPVGATIGGTPSNDIYQAYHNLNKQCINESKERMKATQVAIPETIKGDPVAELQYTSPTFYVNNLHFKVAFMDFLYRNINSPVALYIIKYAMVPTFTTDVIQQMVDAVPQELHEMAMYKELVNEIRSANLKVGAQAPDISGLTPDGKTVYLSDFKGKYVFIDIWASWCAPCRREIPHLKEALAYSDNSDKLVVLSYSADDDYDDWVDCIADNQLTHKNWVHISNLKGWNSEVVKLFNVKGIPFTVLIDPDGNVMQFELRGEEMVKRLKGVIDGVNK